ncbi:hypothetical protein VNI00_006298 [Paramarasmius palmivorus]|uniref:Uncharacterized protein n=1 Tax=Paramarasmius palmivorus TaxID=297713 RepID=A0AAW0D9G2_9AGAR
MAQPNSRALQLVLMYGSPSPAPELSSDNLAGNDTSNGHNDSHDGNERVFENDDSEGDLRIRKPTHFKRFARQFRCAKTSGTPTASSSNKDTVAATAGSSKRLVNDVRGAVGLNFRTDNSSSICGTSSNAALARPGSTASRITRERSSDVEEITQGEWKKTHRKAGKRVTEAHDVPAETKHVKLGDRFLDMYQIVADDDNDAFLT